MILVPYHTDAPVYCRPVGTVALIGTCVAFALLFGFPTGGYELVDNLMLRHGELEPWTWITSNFNHQTKQPRDMRISEASLEHGFKVELLKAPGYKSNVSAGRLLHHLVFAIKLIRFLNRNDRPDLHDGRRC